MPAQGASYLPNRSSSFDVAVVGAGVIGLSVAWRVAQRGLSVVVIDRGEPGSGTSAVAAGMVAPIAEALSTEQPLMRLGLASARAYPEFVAELSDASGADPGYLDAGTLLVARDADEAEWLQRELAFRETVGLAVSRLRASAARRLEPALAPTLRLALEIPDDHAVDPRKLTAALARALTRAGGELRTNTIVDGLVAPDGRVVQGVAIQGGERIAAEHVVVAAGVWSPALAGIPEDARVPIHPVKGQILRLYDPSGPGLLTRVLRMTGGYVVPRGDGRYVLGATMEERGFDTTVTAGAVFELLRDAFELLPSVTELVIDELSAGLRPATPDNAPAIGPGALPGLHWATGHFRHGILLAPVTAQIVAAQLAGEDPGELAPPFDPARFAGVPVAA
jgi:glycine oxidase